MFLINYYKQLELSSLRYGMKGILANNWDLEQNYPKIFFEPKQQHVIYSK